MMNEEFKVVLNVTPSADGQVNVVTTGVLTEAASTFATEEVVVDVVGIVVVFLQLYGVVSRVHLSKKESIVGVPSNGAPPAVDGQ